jgi:hypothetical protein
MTNPKSRLFAAVAGALSLGATAAWAVEPSADAKIQQLEAKVAALEVKQAQNSKDLAATVDAVLRDAEKRSQLLANGGEMGAGYDGGFYIRAGDAWVLRPSILFQFWNVTDYREDVVGASGKMDDEWDNGFEVHRLQLAFEGTAFTKDLTYEFRWENGGDAGSLTLLDAYARYMFADDWGFRLGQFKELINHESLVGDQYLLAAERSLLNQAFVGSGVADRTQGASLIYGGYNKSNSLNAELAFTDGQGAANTSFVKVSGIDPNFGVTGRIEYKAFGDWRDYRDLTAKGNKEDLLVLGAGGDWTQTGDGNSLVGAADAQWETAAGLAVYGGGLVQHLDSALSLTGDEETNWGLIGQVGYMFTPSWELFARYDYTRFDNDAAAGASGEDSFNEVTVGFNYYMGANGAAAHRAKFTVDFTWLPDGMPASISPTQLGAQDQTDENEFMLRAQFQLLI